MGLRACSRDGADGGKAKPRPLRTLDTPHAVCRGVPVTAVCRLGLCVCSQMCSQMRFYFDRGLNQMVGLSCKHGVLRSKQLFTPLGMNSLSAFPCRLASSISHGLQFLFNFIQTNWAFQHKFSICVCMCVLPVWAMYPLLKWLFRVT